VCSSDLAELGYRARVPAVPTVTVWGHDRLAGAAPPPDAPERLLVMVFNEEDGRISSNASKEQVLAILTFLLQHPGTPLYNSRQIRVRIRIALQKVQVWVDELQPAADVFSDFVSTLLFLCTGAKPSNLMRIDTICAVDG
jgi:hypothetical protein